MEDLNGGVEFKETLSEKVYFILYWYFPYIVLVLILILVIYTFINAW